MMIQSMVSKRLIWGLLLVLAISSTMILNPQIGIGQEPAQASYYVSPTGSDSNNGTSTSTPFATIAKARDEVRTVNGSMTGDIYIYLMNGMHTLSSTLTLGASDSGTNGYDIIYTAYTGATPVVSGGVDITSGWTVYDSENNIYQRTGVDWDFRQLYVNDQRGVRARSPNVTDALTGAPYYSATKNTYPYTVNAAHIGSWANSGTAEMVVLSHWSQYRGRIASYSGTTVTFKSPESSFAFNHHEQNTAKYYFENALALLDAEGEWFLDSATSTLYYKPRTGDTMNTTTIIAPKVETLVNIEGTNATTKARNIQLSGISFMHSNWLAPNSYGYVDGQAGFRYQTVSGGNNDTMRGTSRYAPALASVQLKHTSNITLDNNIFKFSGGWGVMGTENTDHTSISFNTFVNNASGGVAMGIAGDEWNGQASMQGQSMYDSITDNTVDSNGLDYADSVGIGAMLPQHMTIARNEVMNHNYTGITIGWNWDDVDYGMTNNQVYQNHVHHVMKLLDDGGGIYTLGRMTGNSTFDYNYIHDIVLSSYSGGSKAAGIYFDNGSTGKKVKNNVMNTTKEAWVSYSSGNHHNVIVNNYYNNDPRSHATDTLKNNTKVTGQNWPQAAVDIMNGASPGATPKPALPAPIPGNLALNKTVNAYYINNGTASLQPADLLSYAVDGDVDTKTMASGQWRWKLRVDLGATTSIDRVIVKMPDNRYATEFSIQTSTDGTNYTTVQSVTGFGGGTSDNTITATNARYVMVVAIKPDGAGQTGSQMGISELEVYGPEEEEPIPPPVNLALNKTVNAYFINNNTAGLQPADVLSNAVDGDIGTKVQASGQWRWKLRVDLGASTSISRIVVKMPANLYATQFNIQASTDGTNYTTVKSVTGFGGGTSDNTFTTTDARYIMIVAVKPDGSGQTGVQMAISELEVYN